MNENLITLFIPLLEDGGAEHVMLILAEAFIQKGLAVDLLLTNAQHPKNVRLSQVPAKVNIVDLKASGTLPALLPLTRYLRRHRPFGLLSTLHHGNVMAVWAKYLSRTDTRVVIRVANSFSTEGGRKAWARDQIPHPLVRWFFPRADAVVALANDMADNLKQVFNMPDSVLHVIYNPVPTERINEMSQQPIHHHWLMEKQLPVLLAVGRLEAQKDFATLIRAFQKLEHPARLIILGEGSQRPILEKFIQEAELQERVELVGFVENPYPYMKQASTLVMSSIHEGFPNVLVEALACGCPVVSTDCPTGPSEILEKGRYGRLVPVGDSDALARAISQTLNSPPDPEFLKQRVMAFSPDVIADQYLALLRGDL